MMRDEASPIGPVGGVGGTFNPKTARSLIELIRDLPGLIVQLGKRELQQFTAELSRRLKAAGIGIGLFVGAAFFGLVAFWVLVTAAVLGLAEALPPWLSALIVAVVFLILTAVLAMVGIRFLKRGIPPVPKETVDSLKQDVQAVKGLGKYDR